MFFGINYTADGQQTSAEAHTGPPDWELGGGWWGWDWCDDAWLDCDPGHYFELDEEIITSRQGNGHPWVECHPLCSCKYNGDGPESGNSTPPYCSTQVGQWKSKGGCKPLPFGVIMI